MIGASKILTVSYGTFSCTLEGFDEPFNTMKAIAEYFRDLAAEDRYFGAEPPTPDAAMLHRIAEREIQRRVEAKVNENGIVLRVDELTSTPTAPATLQISVPPTTPPAAPAPTVTALQDDSGIESVAARLAKLRAGQIPAAAASVQPAATEFYAEDQEGEAVLSNLSVLTARAEAMPAASYIVDKEEAALDALLASELPEDEPAPAAAEIAAAEAAAPESAIEIPAETAAPEAAVEAAVETIAEPIAETAAEPQPEPAVAETLPEEDADAFEDAALDIAVQQDVLPEDIQASEAELDAADAADVSDATLMDTIAAALRFEDEVKAVEPAAQSPAAAIEESAAPASTAAPEVEDAGIATDFTAEMPAADLDEDAALAADLDEDAALAAALAGPSVPEPVAAAPEAEAAKAADIGEATPAAAATEKLLRARARVIKIRRTDAQPGTEVAAEPAPQPTGLLSVEAEAALQAELAALEAEAPHAATPRPVRPTRPAATPDARFDRVKDRHLAQNAAADAAQIEGRVLLESRQAVADMDRLIAQTISVMDDEENKRRHSAISHLKAAVAATEADRQVLAANPGKPAPSRLEPYRLDLENAVRAGNPDQRAHLGERPPLLVLVSEQRIDRPKPLLTHDSTAQAARVVMPTRPRRVGTSAPVLTAVQNDTTDLGDDDSDAASANEADDNLFTEAQSFADFAETLSATSLHELIEASAVYCAQVLGCPQFSRTLVMQQLDSLPGDAPDREDSLRVFGTLLREGRITKIRRNQFAVTDRSPLLAEALRNAG